MRVSRLLVNVMGFIVAGLWFGCAGQVPHATPQQIEMARRTWHHIDAGALDRGRSLYLARCGGCHNLYPPSSIQALEWPKIIDSMSERSGLSPGQKEDLIRYLVTVAPRE